MQMQGHLPGRRAARSRFCLLLNASVAASVYFGGAPDAGAQSAVEAADLSDEEKRMIAKRLVAEAIQAQDRGDYEKAVDLYRKAFSLIPHPILMFNVAQAYRLAGHPEKSAPFYRRYLELEPDGREAAAARAHLAAIAAAGVSGADSKRSGVPEAAEAETSVAPVQRPTLDEPMKLEGSTAMRAPPVQPHAHPSHAREWILGGAGVGMIATGVFLAALDGTGSCELFTPAEVCPRKWDTLALGIITASSGGALIAAAAYLHLTHPRRRAPRVGAAPVYKGAVGVVGWSL